ncbi:nitrate reductase [Mesorhizobium sp. M1076]|uniref:nitrate reductase n=1 Tax=Mesorhizobium sp. M1076 TaxID=2957054 RepID=UPI003337A11F
MQSPYAAAATTIIESHQLSLFANPFAPRRALPEKSRQIKAWVRELRKLHDDVVVSITELACRDKDCPDIETVIGIMRPGEKIETIRIHRPITEVTREDVSDAGGGPN